jgi:hypothetical protein
MMHVGPDRKIVSLYVPIDLDKRVEELAAEQRRSKSQMVTLLIERALSVAAAMQM